ncbi:MAG: LysE family translocator [Sphingomonadales bacterium]|nr:LysE family translocator [Sphingomonadales bacterium]MDE2169183.1 LysE family translocator [Sphingomonadales bacterium]
MTFHLWSMFFIAAFLVSATPGPNMLHILSRSVEFGIRRTLPAMAGCLSGLVTLLTASAVGLTALLLAVPGAFTVLRYAGTAYLLYLGFKAWRAPVEEASDEDLPIGPAMTRWKMWRAAYVVSVSNPKAMLFAAAFLPQFINPAAPKAPQFAILVATFALIDTFWYLTYALGGRGLARHLERPSLKRVFNRATGAIFVGFGAILLKSKPA